MSDTNTPSPAAVAGEQAEVRNKIADLAERVRGLESDCKAYATREWVWSKAFAVLIGAITILLALLRLLGWGPQA